jgi:hypothetical protein
MMADDSLVCPGCASSAPDSERFCPACGLPLVYGNEARAAQPPLSRSQERARKVKPQYSEGALVKVVGALNQTEVEFIEGLLLEEGVPCLSRRSGGFDVPEFSANGPRDVLVPESGVGVARDVLLQSEMRAGSGTSRLSSVDTPRRVMAWALIALLVFIVVASITARIVIGLWSGAP